MNVSRRGFFKICTAGMSGSGLVALGFTPTAALAEVRQYKLAQTAETRNTCPTAQWPVACWCIRSAMAP